MNLDPSKEADRIIEFIKSTFKSQKISKAVIAVSGGIDSAVSLSLVTKAIGKENIYTLELPYKRQSTYLSTYMINSLDIPNNQRLVYKLSRSVDKLAVKLNAHKDSLRFGNILVRARMICLFDQAKSKKALVIGTENKSENMLGYYTRFGDQAADLDPISHLYKLQVIALAKFLRVPEKIISAPPSAGLWENQTDEQELGFSYLKADPILKAVSENKSTKNFDQQLVKKVIKRLKAVDFKTKVPYHL